MAEKYQHIQVGEVSFAGMGVGGWKPQMTCKAVYRSGLAQI